MKAFYRLWNKISPFSIPHDAGDFSLIDRKVVDILNTLPEKDRMFRGLRAWVGFPQIAVPFTRAERFAGQSTQSYLSYFSFAGFAISSFSYFPLRLVTMVAGGFVAFNILFFLLLLGLYFIGVRGPKGYMMLISVVLILGTVTLCCLAIISEYLIRIYLEVKGRPPAIIGRVTKRNP
jgi:dolichol-phosphate mannosyltransferase